MCLCFSLKRKRKRERHLPKCLRVVVVGDHIGDSHLVSSVWPELAWHGGDARDYRRRRRIVAPETRCHGSIPIPSITFLSFFLSSLLFLFSLFYLKMLSRKQNKNFPLLLSNPNWSFREFQNRRKNNNKPIQSDIRKIDWNWTWICIEWNCVAPATTSNMYTAWKRNKIDTVYIYT